MSANDRNSRSPKEWDDEVLRLETELSKTAKIGIELGRELEQVKKELARANQEIERWRHGKTVEGDYVCPDSLSLAAAKVEIKSLQDQILGEHEMLAKELGGPENFCGAIRKLKSDEKSLQQILDCAQRDLDVLVDQMLGGDYKANGVADGIASVARMKSQIDDFDAKAQVAVAEVKVLKRKLEETEKAGEDIRRKNGTLLEREKVREADRKPGGIVRQYNKCLSSIGKVFMLNLPYMNEDDFTRDLYDSELGAIFKAVVDLYNRRVAAVETLSGKDPVHHRNPGCGIDVTLLPKTDDLSKVTCVQCKVRAREAMSAHEREREEAYLKAGLKNVQLDTLKRVDKVTFSAEGLSWEDLSHKYYELLSLARKFNMAIVVLP